MRQEKLTEQETLPTSCKTNTTASAHMKKKSEDSQTPSCSSSSDDCAPSCTPSSSDTVSDAQESPENQEETGGDEQGATDTEVPDSPEIPAEEGEGSDEGASQEEAEEADSSLYEEPTMACNTAQNEAEAVDYQAQAEADLLQLKQRFPSLAIESITDLDAPTRFAELRDLGLSATEAFLASNYQMLTKNGKPPLSLSENRSSKSHLTASLPAHSSRASEMPPAMLQRVRLLFEGMSDAAITELYKKVTK